MTADWITKLPSQRPDGTPLATKITGEMRRWLCSGCLDVNRVLGLGVPPEVLIALWNVKAPDRECQ